MSLKFGNDRSVTVGYAKVPIYYTGIKHPERNHKELVVMERLGSNYAVCYRNSISNRVGIPFLVQATKRGFIFKDKEVLLSNCKKVL